MLQAHVPTFYDMRVLHVVGNDASEPWNVSPASPLEDGQLPENPFAIIPGLGRPPQATEMISRFMDTKCCNTLGRIPVGILGLVAPSGLQLLLDDPLQLKKHARKCR